MNFVRKHIFVSGWVQGVFFRQETRIRAKCLGLFGFIKNLEDGRVEAVVEGKEKKVNKLLSWMRRGPALAKVVNIEVRNEEYKKEFNDFKVVY